MDRVSIFSTPILCICSVAELRSHQWINRVRRQRVESLPPCRCLLERQSYSDKVDNDRQVLRKLNPQRKSCSHRRKSDLDPRTNKLRTNIERQSETSSSGSGRESVDASSRPVEESLHDDVLDEPWHGGEVSFGRMLNSPDREGRRLVWK